MRTLAWLLQDVLRMSAAPSKHRAKQAPDPGPADGVPGTSRSRSILVVDVGGSKIKLLLSGQTEPIKLPSGPELTPAVMVQQVLEATKDWKFDAVSIGYPGSVGLAGPQSEPGNLASGWVGFDFALAFSRPVRILNDAALQALGSYEGGRMLFLGLGTGLGSALISQNSIVPLELGALRYRRGQTYGEALGRRGLRAVGKKAWRKLVARAVIDFLAAFQVDYVMLGGGNSKEFKVPPPGARLGNNQTTLRGGFRLWDLDDVETLKPNDQVTNATSLAPTGWRLL